MKFDRFEDLKNWVRETQDRIGQKVVTTVWLPSRFLEDVIPIIPKNMIIKRVNLDGTTWGGSTFQKIDMIGGAKFYEALSDQRYKMRGVLTNPKVELLELILKKSKELGIRPYIKDLVLEYRDKAYTWQHHSPKGGSSLGPSSRRTRFAKGMQKTLGKTFILDLKSTHNLKETWDIFQAFNGYAELRACGVKRTVGSKVEAVCLAPTIEVEKEEEAKTDG